MNYTLELTYHGLTRFTVGQTKEKCRIRADSIYGPGQWKEVVITETREALGVPEARKQNHERF
jgi:hypothetical protein